MKLSPGRTTLKNRKTQALHKKVTLGRTKKMKRGFPKKKPRTQPGTWGKASKVPPTREVILAQHPNPDPDPREPWSKP